MDLDNLILCDTELSLESRIWDLVTTLATFCIRLLKKLWSFFFLGLFSLVKVKLFHFRTLREKTYLLPSYQLLARSFRISEPCLREAIAYNTVVWFGFRHGGLRPISTNLHDWIPANCHMKIFVMTHLGLLLACHFLTRKVLWTMCLQLNTI